MLEVRKTRELGDVRAGGSRRGIGERQISGGGETEEGGNYSAKAVQPLVESRTKDSAPGRGKSSTQFSLPKITFESPYKI